MIPFRDGYDTLSATTKETCVNSYLTFSKYQYTCLKKDINIALNKKAISSPKMEN